MNTDELRQRIHEELANRDAHKAIETMCEHGSARQLVWWGCLCAWSIWRPLPPVIEDAALGIASRWVLVGGDAHRRDASDCLQSEAAGHCRLLLSAVVNSGGRLKMGSESFAQPTPDLSKRFLFGFVHTLVGSAGPVRQYEVADKFAQIAVQMLAFSAPDPESVFLQESSR
ncbi:MAG TPA: hypothetical protein DDZ51_01190 [Planctomycetaceae bacterium]|nr:hypothetical protein [Planctomycetaceae bacterium]